VTAARRLDSLCEQLRRSVSEAITLLDGDGGESDAYFRLRFRIRPQLERLGAVVYCLHEWPEPDDARPDIDGAPKYSEYRRNPYTGEADECGDRTD
jgi:hypothetical protein